MHVGSSDIEVLCARGRRGVGAHARPSGGTCVMVATGVAGGTCESEARRVARGMWVRNVQKWLGGAYGSDVVGRHAHAGDERAAAETDVNRGVSADESVCGSHVGDAQQA